ncbi:hypothetical protein AMES_6221 [Amycolatopsis mediterranei S699]|uniref:Uncharacterized protein n=3 Tax=Amycolatopsis mediterranei TaxID=33910 RepID=A0A0H3DBL8_AMYMU|nr:hypothetical protein [Amycolatopsis mediterranei]ADJ48046.1 conserved hypothetical protein [Amycolatopsis mediterranei U32]AEK44947.1 hypothetical protein RAM_32370 [Amycolatopsis mediterranei S699]AFO79757.1 hypothetical protein AMES_6221 [Amycolatopsis mediterranei S699]AGT86885.1 hypothetical protein B737_6221 [Amycolatopsis mediterranei RB]KDO10532.1 hypothetical protein DV26_11625 [Amycolatopsis mediterranei]
MTLLLKLVLAPLLVVGSSLAGRRWGLGVTGLLVAMPVVAGPILLITYLEHGAAFVARAASASLLGLVSLAAFAVVFARVSRARGWLGTLLVGWLVCLSLDLALTFAPVPVWVALGLALAAAWTGIRLLPEPGEARPVPLPWWDLPARAVATAGLVVALTAAAGRLGPDLTGVLAPFPTGTSVVAVFAQAQGGPPAAAATVRGVLRGLGGFSAFCFLVAVLVEPIGGWAFVVAVAGTVVWQFADSCRSFGK